MKNRLVLNYPISSNRYWRTFGGRVVVSREAQEFKNHVRASALAAGVKLIAVGDVALTVVLHPRKPKRATESPVRCLDISNSVKVVEDALQGIAFINDRQVSKLSIERGEPVPGGGLVVEWEAA